MNFNKIINNYLQKYFQKIYINKYNKYNKNILFYKNMVIIYNNVIKL